MGYIKDAFVKAAESQMMCYRCKQKVEYIDDLCYCEISDTKCHHGTTCCYRRKIHPISYYDLLGVNKRATTDEINKKFKKVMLEYHTDRNPDGAVMGKIFSEAKNTLTDPRARAIYDAQQGYSSYSSAAAAAGGGGQHSWWTGLPMK
uniref:J domain-containing protein n=1 Tax=Globodera pallida TaxID=36090 RepID=A0A183CKB5_GLOPA